MHLSRDQTLETADLSGILDSAMFGRINYRPLKVAELSKHRRYFARIKDAIPGKLKAVDKLLDLRIMRSPDDSAMRVQNWRKTRCTEKGLARPN